MASLSSTADPKNLPIYIENWLQEVCSHLQETPPNPSDSVNTAESRQESNCLPAMPTPPISDMSQGRHRDGSPSKRRRLPGPTILDSYQANDDVFAGPEQTPRASVVPIRLTNPLCFPPPPSSDPSLATSATGDSKPKQRRSVSPTKRTFELKSLAKPVEFSQFDDNPTAQLPTDVQALYTSIANVAIYRNNVLPHHLRDEITDVVGQVPANLFDVPHTSRESDVSTARAELRTLREIQSAARDCLLRGCSEPAWNEDVHKPLLRLAISPHHPRIRCENVTTARIASGFLPPGRVRDITNKMVDYVLVLSPDSSTNVTAEMQQDYILATRIRQAVDSEPGDKQTINPTLYTPLRYEPLATSIETKAAGGSAEEGRTQLGVWTAAWHQRMMGFTQPGPNPALSDSGTERQGASEGSDRLITLPLILVVEHEWQLFFACDRGHKIEIVGCLGIGDTRNLLGLYIVLASLRLITEWINGTFRQWIHDVFQAAEHASSNVVLEGC